MRPHLEPLEFRTTPSVYADFNGDGYEDLSIGAHNADFEPQDNGPGVAHGAIHVLYGTAGGLSVDAAVAPQMWTPQNTGVADAEWVERFGADLAAGDFRGP